MASLVNEETGALFGILLVRLPRTVGVFEEDHGFRVVLEDALGLLRDGRALGKRDQREGGV